MADRIDRNEKIILVVSALSLTIAALNFYITLDKYRMYKEGD